MKYIKVLPFLLVFVLAASLLLVTPGTRAEAAATSAEYSASQDEVTITLSDSGSSASSPAVSVSGSTVTITAAGDYVITGSLSDGQIIVDAPEDAKVRLILNGVSIVKKGHAAIYAVSADKLVLSTVAGSENFLQAAGEFTQADSDKVDAAVYAACDLTLSGEGTLNVSCLNGHAIVSRDDLKLKSGTVNLEASNKGLVGKDSVTIEGGVLNADVGTDGVYSENVDSNGGGGITITGGTVNLLTQKDGLDAAGDIVIENGTIVINAGSGQEGKGIKSDADIRLSGGSLSVTAVDDAVHAGGSVAVSGGELTLSTGDDGIHADSAVLISDGSVYVTQSYEGIEGQVIEVSGGTVRVNARDDGFNAAGGNDGSNGYGFFGGDPFDTDTSASLTISGGTVIVNADGDGLDSNGTLNVSGGTVYVSGPTNSANGALDFGLGATVTGGTVIAAGASGMAENFGQGSTQGSVLLSFSAQAAGSTVSIADESGNVLASFQPEKSYNSVLMSTPSLVQGGTYTVTAGTETQTVTLTDLIYGSGMGMMGGPGMGRWGNQGQNPWDDRNPNAMDPGMNRDDSAFGPGGQNMGPGHSGPGWRG